MGTLILVEYSRLFPVTPFLTYESIRECRLIYSIQIRTAVEKAISTCEVQDGMLI